MRVGRSIWWLGVAWRWRGRIVTVRSAGWQSVERRCLLRVATATRGCRWRSGRASDLNILASMRIDLGTNGDVAFAIIVSAFDIGRRKYDVSVKRLRW